jgi:hypothetical protein
MDSLTKDQLKRLRVLAGTVQRGPVSAKELKVLASKIKDDPSLLGRAMSGVNVEAAPKRASSIAKPSPEVSEPEDDSNLQYVKHVSVEVRLFAPAYYGACLNR